MKRLDYTEMSLKEIVDSLKGLKVGDVVDIYTSTGFGSSYRAEITHESYNGWLKEMKEDPDLFCYNHTTNAELTVDVVEVWNSDLDAFTPYDRTKVYWKLSKIRSRVARGPRYGLTRFLHAHAA